MQKLLDQLMSVDWQGIVMQWGERIVAALLVFLIGRWIAKLLGHALHRISVRAGFDPTLARFTSRMATVALTIIVAIFAVDLLGVNTTSFLAVLGAAGLAIGLALKDSLANFASSMMIMLFKPFGIGDTIETGSVLGTVDDIGLFSTRLKTGDNQVVTVPNSSITAGIITNYSAQDLRRISLEIGIAYSDDINKARETLLKVVRADDRCKSEPEPVVLTWAFADSSINLMLRVWTENALYWNVRSDLMDRIKQAFDANGISIPFPQRDLHHFNQKD